MSTLDRLAAREKRLKTKLRQLKATRRKAVEQRQLHADAELGKRLREQHPALADLLRTPQPEAIA